MAQDYAGDVSSQEAWEALTSDENAVLIDVRTEPEWQFVGVPDLSEADKKLILASWQVYPDMAQNERFAEVVKEHGVEPGQPIYLLCRSGQRSRAAAIELTKEGLGPCYNIAGGFEGSHDERQRRGTSEGWKVAGLPWRQG